MPFLYLIAVIVLLSLNLRPSITSVGPLLDLIQMDLGMNGLTASLLTTLPVFCMGFFAIFCIHLSNRFGLEISLLLAMLLIFLATFWRAFIDSSAALLATALFAGIGIGIASPLVSGFIKKYFPNRLGVTGVYSVSMVVGAAVASSLSIPLFQAMRESWQYALSSWSLLALCAAFLLVPLVRKALIGQKASGRTAMSPPSLRMLNKRVYWSMLFFGCMSSMFYSVTAWLAPYVQALGFTFAQSGLILTIFTVIQIPISFFIPMLASRSGNRKLWLLLCSFSELIGVILLMLHVSPWIASLFIAFGAGGLFPLALLIPIEEASSVEEATSWSALMQFGGFMLGSLGPAFFGLAVDLSGGFQPALIVMLVTIGIMIASIFKIGNKVSSSERASR